MKLSRSQAGFAHTCSREFGGRERALNPGIKQPSQGRHAWRKNGATAFSKSNSTHDVIRNALREQTRTCAARRAAAWAATRFFRRSCPSEDAPAEKMAGRAYVHPVPQRNSDPPRLENPGSPCQGSVGRLQLFFLRRNIGFHDESSEYCGYSSSEASNPVRSNPVRYEYQRSKTR